MPGGRSGSRLVRFCLVGVANTAVHYAIYIALWFVVPYLVAHLVAASVAMAVSYLLNCYYTFRVPPTLLKFLLYPLSNLTNLALSAAAVYTLVEYAGVDSRIATFAGGVVAVPATFLVSRFVLTRTSLVVGGRADGGGQVGKEPSSAARRSRSSGNGC
ncbi:GtrA family protein [Saccharopolyspora sp. ASAGF58]|uniref:GtrA family protein n=1 Tax=Saccharopolyspora sp. ASAGF58 TaxID=2719023 RepID=UPI00144019D3|nr:GtrA family protein [Saccharopolyspora sp. ASAGF58]QIZ36926.1 GtrA family protein [Saccharopolyspora sp. ASAGF58]